MNISLSIFLQAGLLAVGAFLQQGAFAACSLVRILGPSTRATRVRVPVSECFLFAWCQASMRRPRAPCSVQHRRRSLLEIPSLR